jgi:hypothetical protein
LRNFDKTEETPTSEDRAKARKTHTTITAENHSITARRRGGSSPLKNHRPSLTAISHSTPMIARRLSIWIEPILQIPMLTEERFDFLLFCTS